jgi:hypothetical protein
MTIADLTRLRSCGVRCVLRWCASVAALVGLVAVVGALRAALLVLGAVLVWAVARWLRWEAGTAGPKRRPTVVRPAVWTRPVARPADGLGSEGHRAYARALHAVTGAYLAECEREAGR